MLKQKRLTVAVVDDNDVMRAVLRAILRGEEFEVVGEARNGLIAIELVERARPDIVCLDVVMPEMDGLEALVQIKTKRPETHVVMVTGSADAETVQGAIMNGAAGFILKPFNAARVIDTLRKVASRKPAQRAG